jgi:catalase
MAIDEHATRDVRTDGRSKDAQLEAFRESGENQYLTTNQGVRVNHTDDSLKAGARGPTLMEDFHFREKLTHFDHERIPERVVHARGAGAHGFFQPYESLAELTKASFLQDPAKQTPVFVRFSTVVGSRGSADTVRDVRGFAVKFYTDDGNFDLVGNNMPIFFIQDAIKFPDLVHAIKPEPHNEIPQAAAAHDTFWDFVSVLPESMHMIMWVLSDRAIPRSYRMMQGFGVHTFRFVNEQGTSRFVKFHWRPTLGMHSLVWDEAQKLAGKDPDFNRRDLWEAIDGGDYPEWELGVQIVEEQDEHAFDFDLLDATKIIPEELVPVRPIGKMTLNRNPDNFFAETEQAAFHIGHVVPGIDFTNDPLLQGRLFSYLDTQLIRLGGPNFAELPINRPVAPVHNNQRDGYGRQTINRGGVAYSPNTLGRGCPMTAPENLRGYVHYAEKVDGHKIRERSESFRDHFSQATLFWNSLSGPEQDHLVEAAHFELGKVGNKLIRQALVDLFNNVDHQLATRVAAGIGVPAPSEGVRPNHGRSSPALSMTNTVKNTVKTRRVAILAEPGFNHAALMAMKSALLDAGARTQVVSKNGGTLTSAAGEAVPVEQTFLTTGSIMFDAVFVPGGRQSVDALKRQGDALHFIAEAYKHGKAIAATGEGLELLAAAGVPDGAVTASQPSARHPDSRSASETAPAAAAADSEIGTIAQTFIDAIAQHRHWHREGNDSLPA